MATTGPGAGLGLYEADVTVPTGNLTRGSVDQDGTTLTYDSDTSGVVANPGQAVLPVQTEDVAYSTPSGINEVLRGVGFWGGSYSDTAPSTVVTPLTGDPVTETYEPATPFASSIFYPETLSNTDYFPTLESGGDTDLGITPEQYITNTEDPGVGTAIKREYSDTQFALFYSDYFGSAALASAPSISNVSVTANSSVVTVSATVLGKSRASRRSGLPGLTRGVEPQVAIAGPEPIQRRPHPVHRHLRHDGHRYRQRRLHRPSGQRGRRGEPRRQQRLLLHPG